MTMSAANRQQLASYMGSILAASAAEPDPAPDPVLDRPLPFPEGTEVERDVLELTTRIDRLTGKRSPEETRSLTLRFPDGRREELRLELHVNSIDGSTRFGWNHYLGRGSSHGSGGSEDIDRELARAIADVSDPECPGSSVYGHVLGSTGTVHLFSQYGRHVPLDAELTVRAECGRSISGRRISATSYIDVCGGCRNATSTW
jgi:hypothetical protein